MPNLTDHRILLSIAAVVPLLALACFSLAQAEMLHFPEEGHRMLKPQNSELGYKTVNTWCDRWMQSNVFAKSIETAGIHIRCFHATLSIVAFEIAAQAAAAGSLT